MIKEKPIPMVRLNLSSFFIPRSAIRNPQLKCADGGIRTHTPFSRERILSPLRLPFRHIGGFNGGSVATRIACAKSELSEM